MSTFSVPIVQIPGFGKHPNADTLSITSIEGNPCIFRTGDFKVGDIAVYIPVDAVIPMDKKWVQENLSFLDFKNGKHRVKAKKIRNIFSMGILVPVSNLGDYTVGTDVASVLGITKWEETELPSMNTGNERDLSGMPTYTDIESYRKYKAVLDVGESVVVSEKIHGCNSRYVYRNDRLWVGSHKMVKARNADNLWWKVAEQYGLEEKLKNYPDMVLYGEVYGQVQDLKYGTKPGEYRFAAFDVIDIKQGKYLDFEDFYAFCKKIDIPVVPIIYVGKYYPETVDPLADGKTTIEGADNIREGIVIKPLVERWNHKVGRVVVKLVSEAYLLRKGGSEMH